MNNYNITKCFPDNMTITFNLPQKKLNRLIRKLESFKQRTNKRGTLTCKNGKNDKLYKTNFNLTFQTKYSKLHPESNNFKNFTFRISTTPTAKDKGDRNNCRLEFNSNKAGIRGTKMIRRLLDYCIGNSNHGYFLEAKVTRADMCMDTTIQVDYNELYPYLDGVETSVIKINKLGLATGTIVGSTKSKDLVTFYNKLLELEQNGIKVAHKHLHRIELRTRPHMPLKDFCAHELKSKLLRMQYYGPSLIFDKRIPKRVRDKIRQSGINSAIGKLPPKKLETILKKFQKHRIPSPYDIRSIDIDTFMTPFDIFK